MIELPQLELVQARLPMIFPEGSPNRNNCVRELAARAIFTMLYTDSVEGSDRFVAPKHVCRMSDDQANLTSDDARARYWRDVQKPGFEALGKPWYADNTREPLRDETLREGLIQVGAVVVRHGLPTTSPKPRYALSREFATLFAPSLADEEFATAAIAYQQSSLSPSALQRIALRKAVAAEGEVLVRFPNGEVRRMAAGPSSNISKAVIEEFAVRFLRQPVVVLLSESERKIIARDESLTSKLGLKINIGTELPDIVLADVGADPTRFVFVEVVATDGPVTDRRQEAIFGITDRASIPRVAVYFVSAFDDRSGPAFKRAIGQIAWGTLAWFVAEPNRLLMLVDESKAREQFDLGSR